MEQIDQYCNTCKEETTHDILSSSHEMVIRCTECSSVRRIPVPKEAPMIEVKTIVSREKVSTVCKSELASDEEVEIGDLVVAECEEGEAAGAEIMSIEIGDKRVERAVASDIDTLWTRAVDQVVVRFSVHEGWTTIPLSMKCDGDEKFFVGDVYEIKGVRTRINHIRMRNGSVTKRKGKFEYASGIKRIYGWKTR